MNLIERAQAIVLKPKETWPVIEQEAADVPGIYKNYLVFLAAIPAVAGFIGLSLIGMSMFGVSIRVPMVSGLLNMVVGYVLSLVMVYVLSLIADALASTFGGQKNPLNAFKLVAYASTAGMLGGIFSILPSLSILGLLASLYSIYLLYTGIPVLMKAPQEKAAGYTAVMVVCFIVAAVILGAASTVFSRSAGVGPGMSLGGIGSSDAVQIKIPGTEVTLDTAKLEAASRKMEEANRQLEAAQAKGDSAAAGKAAGDLMAAALGGPAGKPIAPDALKAFVPDNLAGMSRTSIEARSDAAMGMNISSVNAQYSKDQKRIEVKVQDLGAMPALTMAMGAWAQSTVNRETQTEVERVFQKDGISYKEEFQKDGSRAELDVMLGNGVMLEINGRDVGIDTLRAVLGALNLKGLSGIPRPQ
jgi:hypothetical protein